MRSSNSIALSLSRVYRVHTEYGVWIATVYTSTVHTGRGRSPVYIGVEAACSGGYQFLYPILQDLLCRDPGIRMQYKLRTAHSIADPSYGYMHGFYSVLYSGGRPPIYPESESSVTGSWVVPVEHTLKSV